MHKPYGQEKREPGLQLEFYTSQDLKEKTSSVTKKTIKITSKLVESDPKEWANNQKFKHQNTKSIGSQKSRDRYSSQKKKSLKNADDTIKEQRISPYKEYIDSSSENQSPNAKSVESSSRGQNTFEKDLENYIKEFENDKQSPKPDDDVPDDYIRDSLSSGFKPKPQHQRFSEIPSQVQIIQEEGIHEIEKQEKLLPNSEIKQNQDLNSNQSSVARFGLQGLKSSHGLTANRHPDPKKLSFSMSKGSDPPPALQGKFDISQRSTMMQGVVGPNSHQVEFKKNKSSSGSNEINQLDLNNRFKASSDSKGLLEFQNSDDKINESLEFDQKEESKVTESIADEDHAKNNLQLKKLLTEKVYDNPQPNELCDALINKQSFSVNPPKEKKQLDQGNFMHGLNQYTQDEDRKQQNFLVAELRKENQELGNQIKDKDKVISDLKIQIKYERIQKWKTYMKYQQHKRDRGLLKKMQQALVAHGLPEVVQYCVQQQNAEIQAKMRRSQLSQSCMSQPWSRMSMTSYPLFGSDYGAGLSASAYSRHSRMSGFSRSRSVSPANLKAPSGYSNDFATIQYQNKPSRHFKTFHGQRMKHNNSSQMNQSQLNLFQTTGGSKMFQNGHQNENQKIQDSVADLSSSNNFKKQQSSFYGRDLQNYQSLQKDKSIPGRNSSVVIHGRGNKYSISRTMGPSTPQQEGLITPSQQEKLKNHRFINQQRNQDEAQQLQLESSTNFAELIKAQSNHVTRPGSQSGQRNTKSSVKEPKQVQIKKDTTRSKKPPRVITQTIANPDSSEPLKASIVSSSFYPTTTDRNSVPMVNTPADQPSSFVENGLQDFMKPNILNDSIERDNNRQSIPNRDSNQLYLQQQDSSTVNYATYHNQPVVPVHVETQLSETSQNYSMSKQSDRSGQTKNNQRYLPLRPPESIIQQFQRRNYSHDGARADVQQKNIDARQSILRNLTMGINEKANRPMEKQNESIIYSSVQVKNQSKNKQVPVEEYGTKSNMSGKNHMPTGNHQSVIFTSQSEQQARADCPNPYQNKTFKPQIRPLQRLNPNLETLPAEMANIFLTTDCVDLDTVPNIEVEPAEKPAEKIVLKKINEEKESNLQTYRSIALSSTIQNQQQAQFKRTSETRTMSPEDEDLRKPKQINQNQSQVDYNYNNQKMMEQQLRQQRVQPIYHRQTQARQPAQIGRREVCQKPPIVVNAQHQIKAPNKEKVNNVAPGRKEKQIYNFSQLVGGDFEKLQRKKSQQFRPPAPNQIQRNRTNQNSIIRKRINNTVNSITNSDRERHSLQTSHSWWQRPTFS